MVSPDDFREAIPVHQVNKALGEEYRFKGLTGQYIGYLYLAFAGCFALGLVLNILKLPLFIAFPLPIVLFLIVLQRIRSWQKTYGRYGYGKKKSERKAPDGLRRSKLLEHLIAIADEHQKL